MVSGNTSGLTNDTDATSAVLRCAGVLQGTLRVFSHQDCGHNHVTSNLVGVVLSQALQILAHARVELICTNVIWQLRLVLTGLNALLAEAWALRAGAVRTLLILEAATTVGATWLATTTVEVATSLATAPARAATIIAVIAIVTTTATATALIAVAAVKVTIIAIITTEAPRTTGIAVTAMTTVTTTATTTWATTLSTTIVAVAPVKAALATTMGTVRPAVSAISSAFAGTRTFVLSHEVGAPYK